MFTVHEAVRELKLLWCKNHYTNNDVLEYHTCLNVIEEALVEEKCVILDLESFNSDSPDECFRAIQKCKASL